MIVTDAEWQWINCGSRLNLQLVKTTTCFILAWSLQSRGFGLEDEVGSSGSSCLRWDVQSLAESAFAKHPFACTGATSRTSTSQQLLWNAGQLKKQKEKPKQSKELVRNLPVFLAFCSCLKTYTGCCRHCWCYCLFIECETQHFPQFSKTIRAEKKSTCSCWISYIDSSRSSPLYLWKWTYALGGFFVLSLHVSVFLPDCFYVFIYISPVWFCAWLGECR